MSSATPVPAEAVAAARERGDLRGAVVLALAAWRRTRHPVAAQVVEALSEAALRVHPGPVARGREAFQRAWLTVARGDDEVAAGWLARTLTRTLGVQDGPSAVPGDDQAVTRHAAYLQRLEALRARAPDPRLASALVGFLEAPTLVVLDAAHTRPLYQPVVELLARLGDVRARPRLAALLSRPTARWTAVREVLAELLPPLLESLGRLEPEALPDEAAWRRLLPAAPAPPTPVPGEAALLEAVLATPGDDRLRLVYADALQERGDPKGELIALQLAPSPSLEQLRRAATLLRKHRDAWLGPLKAVLKRVEFERGFLASAELASNAAASAQTWAAAAGDPRLATVRVLRQGRGSGEHLEAFLASGALRALEVCELPSARALKVVGRPPLSDTIRHLVLPRRFAPRRLEEVGAVPWGALQALTVAPSAGAWSTWIAELQRAGLTGRLRRLDVTVSSWTQLGLVREVLGAFEALPNLHRLAVHSPFSTPAEPVAAALERDPPRPGARLTFSVFLEREVLEAWGALAAGLREVVVLGTGRSSLRQEAALRRLAEAAGATLHLVS